MNQRRLGFAGPLVGDLGLGCMGMSECGESEVHAQNLARPFARLIVALGSQRYGVAPSSLLDSGKRPSRSFAPNF